MINLMKHSPISLPLHRARGVHKNKPMRPGWFRLSVTVQLMVLFGAALGQPRGAYKKDDDKTIAIIGMKGSTDLRLVEFETGLRCVLKLSGNSIYKLSDNPNVSYEFSGDRLMVVNATNKQSNYGATKLNLREIEIAFDNEGMTLYGRLVLPKGEGKFPAVVIVQGSDTQSAVDTYEEPYMFASHGIACFVYDKRGTGRSQNLSSEVSMRSTPSFPLLASDLVAAVDTLSHFSSIDKDKIGLSGYSQGGWIAPLAASRCNKIKFVVVNYGLAMSIAEEAWQETPMKLADRGINDKRSLTELSEVDGALHQEVKNDFQEGWYDRIQSKVEYYKGRPWLDSMRQIPTTWLGFFLNTSKENALNFAPGMMRTIQPFYDPVATLRKLNIPMFWLIAAEDIEAPPQLTIERINELKASGKPFDLKIYPNTDHGILLFRKETGKKRVYTNYAETYYADVIRWVQLKTK